MVYGDSYQLSLAKFLFSLYKSNIMDIFNICNIEDYVHDPTHYVFLHLPTDHYKFYTKIEKTGVNILQDKKCKYYLDVQEGKYDSDASDHDTEPYVYMSESDFDHEE